MQFGDRIITLMAALVLVLQIAVVAQRWIITHIRIFAIQSFLLAMIAATIAWFNHAPHIYIAAGLTLVVKVAVPRSASCIRGTAIYMRYPNERTTNRGWPRALKILRAGA